MAALDNYLSGYATRQIDDAAAVLRTLRRRAISPEAFLQWAEARVEARRQGLAAVEQAGRERWRKGKLIAAALQKHAPCCPDCGVQMTLYSGDNQDCHWVCRKCRHSIYKPHPPETELRNIGVKEI